MKLKNELCNICPRKCNINRNQTSGFCGNTNTVKIAKVMKHYFEEPVISGTNGSGAVFFSGCNLKCIYCQNAEISSGNIGKEVSIETLADIFKQLEESKVHNINLVTPTHFTNQILEALKIYKPKIPIVWNTSGYESVETIKKLKGVVDIYLTDIKYYSSELSGELSLAPNYFENTSEAVVEMKKQQPKDIIKNGIMKKGVIVRHLVLPGQSTDSIQILNWIKDNLGKNQMISLMAQYTPYHKALLIPKWNKPIKPLEYKRVERKMFELGFENGYVQDAESSGNECIPDFINQDNDFVY